MCNIPVAICNLPVTYVYPTDCQSHLMAVCYDLLQLSCRRTDRVMNIVYHTYISLRYLLLQSYLYNLAICYRSLCHRLWHKIQDELEEERLSKSGAAFGSTKRGIAYAYSDKYRKKTIRPGDLLHLDEEYDELPVNAKRYINFLEDMLRHEIQFVSVGAERNQYLLNGKWL